MCFVSVMLVPIVYYFIIPIWLTKAWVSRVQFWAGLFMYIFCGPFLNIAVLLYASFYMDSFGWGKTRKVIVEDESESKCESELQRLENGDVSGLSGSSNVSAIGLSDGPIKVHTTAQPSKDCADEEKKTGC